MYECLYVCMYACMYECNCVCIYMYTGYNINIYICVCDPGWIINQQRRRAATAHTGMPMKPRFQAWWTWSEKSPTDQTNKGLGFRTWSIKAGDRTIHEVGQEVLNESCLMATCNGWLGWLHFSSENPWNLWSLMFPILITGKYYRQPVAKKHA